MLMTQQRAGLSLAVTHMLTQRELIHCECWTISIFLSMITNRVKNIDAMLKIPTSCGCFVDNEKHGRDVDATVLSIGLPMCITHKPCSYVC